MQKQKELLSRTPGLTTPWETAGHAFFDFVRAQVPFDALLLGVFHRRKPQTDEALAVHGLPADAIRHWCESGLESVALFRQAGKKGFALGAPSGQNGEAALGKFGHVMVHVLPEPHGQERTWWLVLANRSRAWSETEQQVAGLLLRQWQVAFDQMQQPIVGRVLVGHDNRLIHADLWTQTLLLKHPEVFGTLLGTLHPVLKQRWPGDADAPGGRAASRDIAVELAGQAFWVRFHDGAIEGLPDARRWYIELHPLEKGELPVVGVVEDERIARAIGFIHDNYHRSPSLNEIADAVHVSPFHFHRLFSRHVGLSPKHYLQSKQLQMARWMLRSSHTPVGTVAQKTGFSSHGHFTSTFHRLVGRSPTQYREEH